MTDKPKFQIDAMECLEWLRGLADESIDLFITNPAYESLEKHRKVGTTTRLTKRWFPVVPNSIYMPLLAEIYRVLKPNSHCYLMCDQETHYHIKAAAEAAGFTWWKAIIWDKINISAGYHYRARHEFICFIEKGKLKLSNLAIPDVLAFKSVRGKDAYPTEKPVDLFKVLVEQSSLPGQIVADCFTGSASSGEASLALNRNYMACDLLADAAHEGHERLLPYGTPATLYRPREQLVLSL